MDTAVLLRSLLMVRPMVLAVLLAAVIATCAALAPAGRVGRAPARSLALRGGAASAARGASDPERFANTQEGGVKRPPMRFRGRVGG